MTTCRVVPGIQPRGIAFCMERGGQSDHQDACCFGKSLKGEAFYSSLTSQSGVFLGGFLGGQAVQSGFPCTRPTPQADDPKPTTTDDGRVLFPLESLFFSLVNLSMSSNPICTPTCTALTPQIFGLTPLVAGIIVLLYPLLPRSDQIFSSASSFSQSSDPSTLTQFCFHLDHHFTHSKSTALVFTSFATLSTSLHLETRRILFLRLHS